MTVQGAIPWWILLIRGDRTSVEPLVTTSWRFKLGQYLPDDVAFVSGRSWTGVVCYRREPPPYELADELVDEIGLEVIVLDLGDYSSIARRVDGRWDIRPESRPSVFAREQGIPTPWLDDTPPKRASRIATVLPNATVEDLVNRGLSRETLVSGPHGMVFLGDASRATRGMPKTIATRFLDDGEFSVAVLDGKTLRECPASMVVGRPPLTSIAGETEPRAIVKALGIPEEWMFPPDDN